MSVRVKSAPLQTGATTQREVLPPAQLSPGLSQHERESLVLNFH